MKRTNHKKARQHNSRREAAGETSKARSAGHNHSSTGNDPVSRATNGQTRGGMPELFTRFATSASRAAGNPATFAAAALVIILWGVSGPAFGFSDTWQLIINTSTTIITFLMVFLIQNTQNRDNEAIQIKLDELIRSANGAHNALLDLEDMTVDDLDKIRSEYENLAKEARHEIKIRTGHNRHVGEQNDRDENNKAERKGK